MNVPSAALRLEMAVDRSAVAEGQSFVTSEIGDEVGRARARQRSNRQILVQVLRIGLGVLIVGLWEVTTRFEWVDPFFFGQPSGIAEQIVKWAANGTAQGPLLEQILVTLEETVLGFAVGVALGVVFASRPGTNRA